MISQPQEILKTQFQTQFQTQQDIAVNIIIADENTRFLKSLLTINKAFRIPCTIRVSEKKEIDMNKSQI